MVNGDCTTCLPEGSRTQCYEEFHEFYVKWSLDNKQKEEQGLNQGLRSLQLTLPLVQFFVPTGTAPTRSTEYSDLHLSL